MFKGRKRTIDLMAVALKNWADGVEFTEDSLRRCLSAVDVDPDVGVFVLSLDGNVSITDGLVDFRRVRPIFREDV